ncbi:hypothetical protein BGX31_003010 [Mortierella sp. GBA43]|nr:hypothetical protein BGX31_003010 [Mortierella sp. GBA43]
MIDSEDGGDNDDDNGGSDGDRDQKGSNLLSRCHSWDSRRTKQKKRRSQPVRKINERVHHTCMEAIAVVDHLMPGARFGLMGHSCGFYYIMHMVELFPERIRPGPISLLTPWVPFNECPDTTSRTFKFLKHIPKGIVWAVTSSINHLGSMILSSSNALSGAWSSKNVNCSGDHNPVVDDDEMDQGTNRGSEGCCKADESTKKPAEPFIVQFSDAFDKVLLPALVQDMNRQHSNGYSSEIQMCISDVGFDLASVNLPDGVTINAYCGRLDTVVPIEASRQMGAKCGWKIHEFKYSGHGGPRMSMYSLEDYALAIQVIKATKIADGSWSEKNS